MLTILVGRIWKAMLTVTNKDQILTYEGKVGAVATGSLLHIAMKNDVHRINSDVVTSKKTTDEHHLMADDGL